MDGRRLAGWVVAAALAASPAALLAAATGLIAPSPAPLVEAVRHRDAAAVRAALRRPGAVNVAEPDGTTALHVATDLDDVAMAKRLIQAGAHVTAANRYGFTPLYAAAVYGDAAMIQLLLDAGADPNTATPEGETALMTAARTGKTDAIHLLLTRGAHVNAVEQWKHQTALMWAAHEGNTDAVRMLIEAGADIEARSIFGWTPLLFAARQGQTGAIEALASAGADVNETLPDGTSALITAVQGLNYEAAGVLLEYGVDPNAAAQGWTALHQIVWSRRPQRGQNNPGQKPQGDVSSIELARMLVEYGADINARETKEPTSDMEGRNSLNRYGATPFFLAAKSVDVPMMRALLDLGADPFLGNVDGDTPLMVAAGVGVFSQGESPGTPEESADAVKLLLDLGAPVNDMDKHHETALHGPAWRGSNDAVTLLVDAGAKLDVRDDRGWLPLTIANGVYFNARVMSNPQTAQLLRELMTARGLDASDTGADTGGALRAAAVNQEDVAGVDNPADLKKKLLEQEQQREAALEKLEGAEK